VYSQSKAQAASRGGNDVILVLLSGYRGRLA